MRSRLTKDGSNGPPSPKSDILPICGSLMTPVKSAATAATGIASTFLCSAYGLIMFGESAPK
jgi:hypothetical protein